MCLIAYSPTKAAIPAAVIDAAMTRHPDGFGLMWRDATGLHTKAFAPKDRAPFKALLAKVNRPGVEYAAHFRFATSGPKDVAMAHPYTYEDPDPEVGTVAVMHNGIINIAHDRNRESDTAAFVRLVLARLPSRWWTEPAFTFLVGEAIGWSRLVLMTETETVNLQERDGTWDGGVWYSSEHRPVTYTTTTASTWTPARQTAASNPTPPTPGSKRSVKRAAAQAARDARKAGKVGTTALINPPALTVNVTGVIKGTTRVLRHAGHNVTFLVDINPDKDGDYQQSVACDTCRTIGDVFAIDGDFYVELAHQTGVVVADQLAGVM
jgi:hypothetical protein